MCGRRYVDHSETQFTLDRASFHTHNQAYYNPSPNGGVEVGCSAVNFRSHAHRHSAQRPGASNQRP